MIPRSQSKEAGFTLVELLVSLILLAVMTMLLVEGLQFALQPMRRQIAHSEEMSTLPVVYRLLRTHLADARPIAPIDGELDAVAFDGREDRLDFVSAAPQASAEGGLYLFRLDVESGQLHLHWHPFDGLLRADDRVADDAVLLDGVRRVEMAYYGQRVSDTRLAWRSEWRQVAYLPLLVRIEFQFNSAEVPPVLIVAPRLEPLRAVPFAVQPAADPSRQ